MIYVTDFSLMELKLDDDDDQSLMSQLNRGILRGLKQSPLLSRSPFSHS